MRTFSNRRRSAFTLIELLVVVAIIALLIAILLPSLSRAKETAMRTKCAANLHATGLALASYANQWNDFFPIGPNGNWMWDMAYAAGDTLITANASQNNGNRSFLYCPSNPIQQDPTLWTFSVGGNGVPGAGFDVFGYFFMTLRSGGGFPSPTQVTYLDKSSKTYTDVTTQLPLSSTSTVLAADGTLYGADSNGVMNFAAIKGGWSGGQHTTSHLSHALPAGRNILYLDYHAEWKSFSKPTIMSSMTPGAANNMNQYGITVANSGPLQFW